MGITRVVHEATIQRSVGIQKTFTTFISEWNDYLEKVGAMATELAERLDEQKIMAKTLTLELKTTKFEKK